LDDGIVGNRHACSGVALALLAIGDDERIVAVRPLFDDVVLDRRVAAIGQVDRVASGAIGIEDAIIGDGGVLRPALISWPSAAS